MIVLANPSYADNINIRDNALFNIVIAIMHRYKSVIWIHAPKKPTTKIVSFTKLP